MAQRELAGFSPAPHSRDATSFHVAECKGASYAPTCLCASIPTASTSSSVASRPHYGFVPAMMTLDETRRMDSACANLGHADHADRAGRAGRADRAGYIHDSHCRPPKHLSWHANRHRPVTMKMRVTTRTVASMTLTWMLVRALYLAPSLVSAQSGALALA